MKKLALVVYLSLAGCSSLPPNVQSDETPAGQLASMVWLEGDWIGPSRHGVWQAHYSSPNGGAVLGVTKEHYEKQPAYTKFERIEVHEGELKLFPYPQGKRAIPFPLVEFDREKRFAAFQTAKNDFPQRFEFWRVDANTLVIKARKLEMVNGKYEGFIVKLSRM